MVSAVCTLFEGNYHFGVAALTNSLYQNGFRGSIYAGYRGTLPDWASKAIKNDELGWENSSSLLVDEGLQIHFLPLDTDYHLTNYKPDFLLQLLNELAKEAEQLFFFDSDIVVNAKWSLFERWVECGVALCEDVNSPLSDYHPRRVAWRTYYGEKNISLSFKNPIYVNGGFLGVNRNNLDFVNLWKKLQDYMASEIGGMNRSSLNGNTLPQEVRDEFGPFSKTDQDALNATIEAWTGKISYIGKEGMGFKSGSALMLHFLDQPKPWQRNYLNRLIQGISPNAADKSYWKYSFGPIKPYSKGKIKLKKALMLISTVVGRFYRRNHS